MKQCLIFVGMPGTGKTTKRETMIDESFYVYSTDDLIDVYAKENNKTYNEVFKDYYKTARKIAEAGLIEAIKDGKNIAWDQTNLSSRKRKQIVAKIRELGRSVNNEYGIACISINMPDDGDLDWNRRLLKREGKQMSIEVLAKMRKSYSVPSMEEGFDMVMYSNINGEVYQCDPVPEII